MPRLSLIMHQAEHEEHIANRQSSEAVVKLQARMNAGRRPTFLAAHDALPTVEAMIMKPPVQAGGPPARRGDEVEECV